MAANTSTSLVNLDFLTYKNSLKTYLQNNAQFRDFDYEGSNINLIIDLLSYNTFINAFYLNMVGNESFLDSAQRRSSIVSHAKDLNYLPASIHSARATINVSFQATGESQPYTIPKGMPFTASIKAKSFVFTTAESIVVSSANSTFTFETDIYEGTYHSDTYLFNSTDEIQRFLITNQTVDTDSISVTVYEDGSQLGDDYKATDTLLGLDETSKVFFVQATQDGYYEVLFGDNIFGRRPKAQAVIQLTYRVASGSIANGAKKFTMDFDATFNGEMTGDATVTVIEGSVEGAERQSNESIRSYAPRYFATQQRAVATDDYASLILAKFSGQVDDVNVYGGETQEPKLYGRVVVAIKPVSGTIAPNFLKQEITNTMLKYVSIPTRIVITDPEYFYARVDSVVQFDKTATTKQVAELRGMIHSTINTFSSDNLEKFGKDFRYSRFINAIDETENSLISNDTTVKMIKRLTPLINFPTSYEIYFNNQLKHSEDGPTITSDMFTFYDEIGSTYERSYIKDIGGVLKVYTTVNEKAVVISDDVGSVDYSTGKVLINRLLTSDYDTYISLYAKLASKDIIISKQNILFIDLDDVNIEIVEQSI